MRALSLITSGGVAFLMSMGVAQAQTAAVDEPAGKTAAAPKTSGEAKPTSSDEAGASESKDSAEPKKTSETETGKDEKSGDDQASAAEETEAGAESETDEEDPAESEERTVDLKDEEETASTEQASKEEAKEKSNQEKAEKKTRSKAKKTAPPPPPPDYSALPQTYHLRHIDIALGPRVSSATHDGLQPYMYEPMTGELVGRASVTVSANEPWALSVVAQGSGFKRSADARSITTELTVVQFGAGLEARYHMHHRLFAYGRLVAGAEMASMVYGDDNLDDSDVASATNWAFFGDANLGFAFRFAGSSDGRKRTPRAWFFVEGGGRLASTHKAELKVDEDGPNRADPVILPKFSTNGVMGSGGLMISF